jgi:nucleoside 2-deoxyribosyltransferase
MKTVYLAGPIENATHNEMTWWRDLIKKDMSNYDVKFLDPTRREPVHNQKRYAINGRSKRNLYNRILTQDLMDIEASDIIVANIRAEDGRGIGTAMEIMYTSFSTNKPIIAWAGENDQHHPFYEALITEKYYHLEEVIEALRSYVD